MTIVADVVIVGAGVVGLAVAAEVAQKNRSVFVFERNSTFGQETSSRNSEVIHAGLYYPQNSLKAILCVDGNRMLYEICEKHNIAHRKTGKIILAVSDDEIPVLEQIYEQAFNNGVDDIEILSKTDISKLEPNVECRAGILSPSTGIINTHSLMQLYYRNASEAGVDFLFETEVTGLDRVGDSWKVSVRDRDGLSEVTSSIVINCAGLHSERIAHYAEIKRDDYKVHYCKGEYFRLGSRWRNGISHLIYPTPEQTGLGVHATLSLDGMIRLGPNARYVDSIDYKVDSSQKEFFFQSVNRYLPKLEPDELQSDFAGIRPKLQGPSDEFRDFIISSEEQYGCSGLINLVGIESPGLTASPAIAKYVGNMVLEMV